MPLPTLLRVPLVVAVVVGLVAGTYDGGLSAAVRDFRDYASLNDQMSEMSDRQIDLALRSDELRDRITAKEGIVKEVIAGRLSLADATSRFLTLNGDDPVTFSVLNLRYDGSTYEEKVARNVIDHVDAYRASSKGKDVGARLDQQFRARYGHPR